MAKTNGVRSASAEEKLKSASAGPPSGPIQNLQGYREGEMAPVISFQDRGHGMTTERRTMAFFMRAPHTDSDFFAAATIAPPNRARWAKCQRPALLDDVRRLLRRRDARRQLQNSDVTEVDFRSFRFQA